MQVLFFSVSFRLVEREPAELFRVETYSDFHLYHERKNIVFIVGTVSVLKFK